MNYTRWILIGITLLIVAALTWNFDQWAAPFKNNFLYHGNFLWYGIVIVVVAAITGTFKWLLQEEVILTRPRGRRR